VKLYIAGPMTGIPDFNFPLFRRAEELLREVGYDVENPINAYDGDTSRTWVEYMKADIPAMLSCDGIAVLDGYRDSKGASLEVYIAQELEMPVMPVPDWLHGVVA